MTDIMAYIKGYWNIIFVMEREYMKLKISNVGKMEQTVIEIDGITVIAGENNAGKSTIGKTLFAIFNSMNNMEEKIVQEKKSKIGTIINTQMQGKVGQDSATFSERRRRINMLTVKLRDAFMEYLNGEETIRVEDFLRTQVADSVAFNTEEDKTEFIAECAVKLEDLIAVPDRKVMTEVITRWFSTVFDNQMSPLWEEETASEIEVSIKGKKISYLFSNNKCENWEAELNILHQAFYIDNPFAIDRMSEYYVSEKITERYLLDSLEKDEKDIYENIFDAVAAKEKLLEINSILGEVIDGDIENNQDGEYYFKSRKYAKPLKISNLSAGMKSFALIKRLLETGELKEKDVIILDEPEIHLHPEWQLLYAQLIVLLQKQFDLSMVITTHSPYFLDAIDVFSAKYNTKDRTRYYLAENEGDTARLQDVTDNIDAIYKKLSDPMQMLENLRYNG